MIHFEAISLQKTVENRDIIIFSLGSACHPACSHTGEAALLTMLTPSARTCHEVSKSFMQKEILGLIHVNSTRK
jgi:glutaredoxin-related protein